MLGLLCLTGCGGSGAGAPAIAGWQSLGGTGAVIAPDSAALDSHLELSASARVWLAFADFDPAAHTVAPVVLSRSGSNWQCVGPCNGASSNMIRPEVELALGGETPFIAFEQAGRAANGLSVMSFTDGAWAYVGPSPFTPAATSRNALAVGPDQSPWVAFSDYSVGGRLSVMHFGGGTWNYVGMPALSAGRAFAVRLLIGSGGQPYVVYRDAATPEDISVTTYAGGAWTALDPIAIGLGPLAAALGPQDSLYVAAVDPGRNLHLFSWNGTRWVSSDALSGFTSQADNIGLTIGPGGIPYLAFGDASSNEAPVVLAAGASEVSVVGGAPVATAVAAAPVSVRFQGTLFTGYTNADTLNGEVYAYFP